MKRDRKKGQAEAKPQTRRGTSKAASPTERAAGRASAEEWVAGLPEETSKTLARVRDVIVRNLPDGYEEAVVKGMLVYQVPLSVYSDTYNGQASWYVALAAQKSYNSLYLMSAYGYAEHANRLADGFAAAGKKLDMGKSCIHFKKSDDLALDVIGELIASVPMERWIESARAVRRRK